MREPAARLQLGLAAGDPPERFDVALAGALHDVLGEDRRAGLWWSQPEASSQFRTYCLSNEAGSSPGCQRATSQ